MEALFAAGVGLTFACGLWLVLRPRTFSVVLGLTLITYAVNILILLGGRLGATSPPLALKGAEDLADPLPQALVLTAIVISFGMTAFLIALALRAAGESGEDRVDPEAEASPDHQEPEA